MLSLGFFPVRLCLKGFLLGAKIISVWPPLGLGSPGNLLGVVPRASQGSMLSKNDENNFCLVLSIFA